MSDHDKLTRIIRWYQQQLADAQLQVATLTAELAAANDEDSDGES